MSGSGWAVFWGILLGVTLLAYAVLAVVVTLGGFREIREMFRKLRDRHGEERENREP